MKGSVAMSINEEAVPVIIGVGQLNDRPDDPLAGLNSIELMGEALRIADRDAGGGLLPDADALMVVANLSFAELGDPVSLVCQELGIDPARQSKSPSPMGDSPVRFLNEAAHAISKGESRIVLITGGEALATAGAQAKAAVAAGKPPPANSIAMAAASVASNSPRNKYGLTLPTQVYALYENAMRADRGQSFEEAQSENAALWAGMANVACENTAAWLRSPVSAEEIETPSRSNRMLAYPYLKLMVANAGVNQGAAFIVTSLAEARRRGIDEDRLVFVGHGAAAAEPKEVMKRESFDDSLAIRVTMDEVLANNAISVSDIALAEFYSCFPVVPKMATRAIGWPSDKPITVTGGLTFAGGPIGNFMSHAVARMTQQLRGTKQSGLLFANGGYATTSHAIVISGDVNRAASEPVTMDVQDKADSLRGSVPQYNEDYEGPARIESFTIDYGREGEARRAVIVARTNDRTQRCLALVPGEDTAAIERLTGSQGEPIGSQGQVQRGPDDLNLWNFA